jgi:hypothetical protein
MLNSVNHGKPPLTQAEAEAEAYYSTHTRTVPKHIGSSTPPPKEGVGVSKIVETKENFEVDTRLRFLKSWIEPFFKRPPARITDAEELRLMAEVARRPDLKEEIQLIEGLFRCLDDKSKFPRSVIRLLQGWQQKVDEARRCKTPAAFAEDRELREAQKPI